MIARVFFVVVVFLSVTCICNFGDSLFVVVLLIVNCTLIYETKHLFLSSQLLCVFQKILKIFSSI